MNVKSAVKSTESPESSCYLCNAHVSISGFSSDQIRHLATQMLDGIVGSVDNMDDSDYDPPGDTIVERCADLVTEPCGACDSDNCVLCRAAQRILDAEEQISAERTAETKDYRMEYTLQSMARSFCATHEEFGKALLEEHYRRRSWSASPTSPPGGP